ncbi:zinc finger MYM-type protein 1-like [Heracleum sosnowskyi]|uniref:Zinc finger MYM-type protein 1-like n=1 Tax=Heracleum sosnowskyi TaxID=360622 RepID=A0AAD8IST2_9APIA|nr:zinc finger MYM-type protein 1-like [Heracleum sosnowskyi]
MGSGTATPTPTPSDATPTHIHSADTPTHTPSATPTATSSGTATPSDTSEFDLASLERDPGLRRLIWKYPPNVRDDIRRHIDKIINCQSLEEVKKNRLRLRATIEGVRYLSLQACALRGHDESSTSRNRGNLIEIVKTFRRLSPDISNVVLENAPKNATYTSPKVQKDILHIFASKVRNKIRNEIGDSKFCILVDEALDASQKEQMAIVLRFVDVYGVISERFFDIVNVFDTTSLTLKKELSDVLTRNNLSIQNMRGQGYDGASNMCALVGAAEKQDYVWEFFSMFANVVNIVSGSSKHLSELQTAHGIEVDHSVASGERETGRGLSQIGNLQQAGSTRWSSHFNSVCSLIDKYGSIIVVLESINNYSTNSSAQRGEARGTMKAPKSFKFLFVLYLMHKIWALLICFAELYKVNQLIS